MANSYETTYLDPLGNKQTGYIIDGKTYKDADGTQRVDVGSIVTTQNGDQYVMTENGGKLYSTAVGDSTGGAYNQMNYVAPTSKEQYIKDIYEAQRQQAQADLEAAYNKNIGELDAAAAKIPETYDEARRQQTTQYEINRRSFNEQAAASGLNAGANAQIALSMNTANQGALGAINKAEANAIAEIDRQRALLKTQYQTEIAAAINQGKLEEAQALYNEYIRLEEARLQAQQLNADEAYRVYAMQQDEANKQYELQIYKAELLAKSGDFSGYKALGFTDAEIASMRAAWEAEAAQAGSYSGGYSSSYDYGDDTETYDIYGAGSGQDVNDQYILSQMPTTYTEAEAEAIYSKALANGGAVTSRDDWAILASHFGGEAALNANGIYYTGF